MENINAIETVLGKKVVDALGDTILYIRGQSFTAKDVVQEIEREGGNLNVEFLFLSFNWGTSLRGLEFWEAIAEAIHQIHRG